MGTAPDAVKRLVDARDMTEMSDISDRVPSLGGWRSMAAAPETVRRLVDRFDARSHGIPALLRQFRGRS
jgi:hypothetical protein